MVTRLLTITLFVTVVSGATAFAQTPGVDACVASPDALRDEPFVMATAPLAGARVTSGFAVRGCSRTFESRFAWTLTLRGGKVLVTGTATGGGVDGPAPFSFTVAVKVTAPTLAYLELYEPRMSDEGPPPSRVIVPVVLMP